MKKITLIILLLVLPLVSSAQGPWEFNGTDDNWVKGGGCTAATSSTEWVLTTNGGNNPNFSITTAGVDADANQYAAVTLRLSAGAPSFMRLRVPKTGGGFTYRFVVIDPSETDFVTYYLDATSNDWNGTVNDIRFQFKDDNGSSSGATHSSTDETIEIDRVEFVNELPREEKLVYEFNTDGDDEGFSSLLDANAVVASGNLTITPDGGEIAKITNGVNSVNADVNSHMHIVYQNLSADNNQLRIQFRSSVDNYASFVGTNTSINLSMATFETISLDLETLKPSEWNGTAQDIQLAVRNTNNAGNVSSVGDFVVDRIVFNNNAALTIADLEVTEFSIYPNPATNNISIASNSQIELVRVFDIIGKQVLSEKLNSTINISNLKSGVYLMNVTLVNGTQVLRRFIKR